MNTYGVFGWSGATTVMIMFIAAIFTFVVAFVVYVFAVIWKSRRLFILAVLVQLTSIGLALFTLMTLWTSTKWGEDQTSAVIGSILLIIGWLFGPPVIAQLVDDDL